MNIEFNNYDDGLFLNTNITVQHPTIDKVIQELFNRYREKLINGGKSWAKKDDSKNLLKHKKALTSLISSFYLSMISSGAASIRPILKGRSASDFTGLEFSLNIFKSVTDWLSSIDLIKINRGYYDRITGEGKVTRYHIQENLATKLKDITGDVNFDIKENKIINIRDKEKNDNFNSQVILDVLESLHFPEDETSDLEKQYSINNLRKSSKIEIPPYNLPLTQYWRSFSNSCFGDGGRFYGCLTQRVPKDIRKKIRINEQETVELDYSNLHLAMIYALRGIPLTEDAYSKGKLSNFPRDIIKYSVLVLLNSDNEGTAARAITKELNELGNYRIKSKDIIRNLKEEHHKISDLFCSGIGIKLQHIDSNIALDVMHHFSKKGIVCLSIHDSFIIDKKYKEELSYTMKMRYKERMKIPYIFESERSKIPQIEEIKDSNFIIEIK